MYNSVPRLLTGLVLSFFWISCTSNEIGESKDVKTDAIYFDYALSGEEDDENITCRMQYRVGGSNGTTLVISDPGRVELDGETIRADSTRFAGAYYEIQKPVKGFNGKHTITFTDVNKKQYQEEFDFTSMQLLTNIPETIRREDLLLELQGLNEEDFVRVTLTDTVFTGNGIHRLDTVTGGKLLISRDELAQLATGPVTLILARETELPLKNGTREGGRLTMSFTIKREFELKD